MDGTPGRLIAAAPVGAARAGQRGMAGNRYERFLRGQLFAADWFMFLLHDPYYPDRPIGVDEVRTAWLASGFTKFSASTRRGTLNGHDVRGIINAQLMAAGATLTAADSADFEVPDELEPLLKALESFYMRLYPEMKNERPPRNFFFEKVEWLGEF
jgi:hypothetical protein